jgi:hypothetical protein
MKEFLKYAKSIGIKSIDIDTICLIDDFFKQQESKQSSLNGVSNRRELLLSYHKFLQEYLSLDVSDVWVNEYLKDNNCG